MPFAAVAMWKLWSLVPTPDRTSHWRLLAFLVSTGAVTVGFVILVNRLLRPIVKEWVWISPDGLHIRHRRLLVWRSARFPLDRLEELAVEWPRYHPALVDLPGQKVLCARSDDRHIEIGYGFPDAKLAALRMQILARIRGAAGSSPAPEP